MVGEAEYDVVVEPSGVGGAVVEGAEYEVPGQSGVKGAATVVGGAEYEVVVEPSGVGGAVVGGVEYAVPEAVPKGEGAAYQLLDRSKIGGAAGKFGYQKMGEHSK